MKVNVFTNGEGRITGWVASPLDETLPTYEIEDPKSIRIGYDKFVEGKVVKDDEAYAKAVEGRKKKDAELGIE